MKKLFLAFPFVALMLSLMACGGETYRHQVTILHPSGVDALYADQTSDSVIFASFDSYDVKSYTASWIKVLDSPKYPSKMKIPNDYYTFYRLRVDLEIEPNTTNEVRTGAVSVRSYGMDDWDYTVTAFYHQLAWHDILHPTPSYTYDDGKITACLFESKDSAMQIVDTLRFCAHDKWTLTQPEGSFVTSPRLSGEAGNHTLILNVEPNPSKESRSVEFTLTSANGATTPIRFKQAGK